MNQGSTQKSCRPQGSQLLRPVLALVAAVSTVEGSTGSHGSPRVPRAPGGTRGAADLSLEVLREEIQVLGAVPDQLNLLVEEPSVWWSPVVVPDGKPRGTYRGTQGVGPTQGAGFF